MDQVQLCVRVCVRVHARALSHSAMVDSSTPWIVARQASLSMGFSRQESWKGCHFLFQEIFLTQGSNPHIFHLLHWLMGSLPLLHLGSQVQLDRVI